jgi:multiphosphoryl transfer protein
MSQILKMSCEFNNGIHARPASFLAEFCQQFNSDIKIKRLDSYEFQNAKSAISIVGLNILYNDDFVVSVHGEDEKIASKNIEEYMNGEWISCDDNNEEESVNQDVNYLPEIFKTTGQSYIKGRSVVPGIAISSLERLKDSTLGTDYFFGIDKGSKQDEIGNFDKARSNAIAELQSKLSRSDDNERNLIKFQIQFISDEEIKSKVYCQIYNGYSALEAINKVVEFYVEQFRNSPSEYIRQRDVDAYDIGYRLMSYIDDKIVGLIKPVVDHECILLCKTLTPGQFLSLDKSKIKGLVISNIGETSHTIILAKAYGIPTLINVDDSLFSKTIDTQVVLDGYLGICVYQVKDRIKTYYDHELTTYEKVKEINDQYTHNVTYTKDQQRVEIAANIINAEECEAAFRNGAESIGLLRTEMMYIDSDTCPTKDQILNQINDILSYTNGHQIIVRTLDIGGDKPAKYIDFGEESNPFLGYRGIRIYKDNYNIFKELIESLLLAKSQDNIRIMVPMISCLEEVVWFKNEIEKIKSELDINKKIEIGIMIEVPSIAFMLESCCKIVDFFSIGTNDLMQYFMAADRENSKISYLYNRYNPAFVKFLNNIIGTVKKNEKWIGVCGELASDPDFTKLLVGMGVDELSVGCSSVPRVKRHVANLQGNKCRDLLNNIINLETSDEIGNAVKDAECGNSKYEIICKENIHAGLDFIDKDSAIKYLVDNLYINNFTKNKYSLEQDIWNREKTYSTDIGFGFAIPHTKSNNIEKTSISICKLNKPIKWGEQEVSIIIMLTIKDGDNSAANEHMKIFSLLARKIMNSDFRDSLSACKSNADIEILMKTSLEM